MEQVYVFGCGRYFKMKQDAILKKYEILGILDNNKEGIYILNNKNEVPIILPDEITVKEKKIIIMMADFYVAWEQLRKLGVGAEFIIFSYEIQPLYEEERVFFSKGEHLDIENDRLYYVNEWKEKFLLQDRNDLLDTVKVKERKTVDGKFISEKCQTKPLNRVFGFSRGTPIDRYYIEKFLEEYKELIHGDVLEVADNEYTLKYGGAAVKKAHIMHVNPEQKGMIKGNFETGEGILEESMDCMILTQVLPFMYDIQTAIQNIYRMLKTGGAALITVNGISQISRYDMDRWGHYWSFTDLSIRRLLETVASKEKVIVKTYGNVKIATALLYGLSVEDMDEKDMDKWDEDYQVSICAILRK